MVVNEIGDWGRGYLEKKGNEGQLLSFCPKQLTGQRLTHKLRWRRADLGYGDNR